MASNFPGSSDPAVPKEDTATPKSSVAQRAATTLRRPLTLPYIGDLPLAGQLRALGLLLVGLLVLAAAMVVLERRAAARETLAQSTITEMQMLSQRLAKAAQQSVQGESAAFAQLAESRERYAKALALLTEGGERDGVTLGAPDASLQPILTELAKRWQPAELDARTIADQAQGLLELRRNEDTIERTAALLAGLTQQLLVAVTDQGEQPAVITLVRQLLADTENFDFAQAKRQLSTDEPNPSVALQLGRNVRGFQATLRSLIEPAPGSETGPMRTDTAARAKAETLDKAFAPFAASVESIVKNMQGLARAKQASRDIFAASESLLQLPRSMAAPIAAEADTRTWLIGAAVLFGMAALLTLGLMSKVFIDDAERRAAENEAANQRTQEAILRLLDEMGDLAQGDLTVQARVTEDVTGAIADSVNYAVEEMRRLVQGIIDATAQVTTATSAAQHTSGELLNAAQRQSQEITETSTAIDLVAQSIGEVSDRAAESARVADLSLQAAAQGSDAVNSAIRGMGQIREQIQETAKRIKRLGESSQEIGEIVDLITDITEQTNVLALNAAIQATTAGPAGRGFTVVAEEVQRLAERSAEATKQISAIVKTIQTDTQDAIGAMERSTQGVVEQTRLADATGRALGQIDEVSRQLAALIEAISTATRDQASSAARIAESMNDILRITELTTQGTRRTADSTAQLAELALDLKQSVAGFKLA
jgi:twitching motility protein PilJ